MLEIEELILRVPGYTREEARQLGEEVARRVADGLSDQQSSVNLGALDLRVNVPPETSRSQLAKLIAEAILKGLV
jgi:hypothetical protein